MKPESPNAHPSSLARSSPKPLDATFALLLICGQLFLFATFLRRADKKTSDYPGYYSVARLWERGDNPYSVAAQCKELTKVIGNSCFLLAHPPILLPLLSLVSGDDFTASYWRWFSILACFLIASFCLVWLISGTAFGSAQSIIFYPTVLSVFFGNDTVFVLLGVTVWAYLLLRQGEKFKGQDMLAGAAIALTAVKPQLTIMLAIPLLFAKTRVFLWFCVAGLILTLYSLSLVGVEGFKGIVEITRLMATGKGYGINQEYMINTTGWLVRVGLSPFWSWPLYVSAIVALSVLWKRYGVNVATISLSLLAALFFVPHVHAYDLALLAIPLVFAHRLAPLVASLIMIITIPISLGYIGAFVILTPLAVHYCRSLSKVQKRAAS